MSRTPRLRPRLRPRRLAIMTSIGGRRPPSPLPTDNRQSTRFGLWILSYRLAHQNRARPSRDQASRWNLIKVVRAVIPVDADLLRLGAQMSESEVKPMARTIKAARREGQT